MTAQPSSIETRERLASSLALGAVSLNVRDPARMREFYSPVIGLDVLGETENETMLGRGSAIVILHRADLPAPSFAAAGLYHLAIVFSSQSDLAQAVRRGLDRAPELFQGSADHNFSEAFYFADPEGNGVELYYDRDQAQWQCEADGTLKQQSIFIDPLEYGRRHAEATDRRGGMAIGHVHLKVGDIDAARRFYVDTVGFSLVMRMPSALFVSVGGYHHHLGMNTWESLGAGKHPATLGLRSLELVLPTHDDVRSLRERLERVGVPVAERDDALTFADPWDNRIRVGA